ncbi:ABC transporter permease [Bosea caraganae]|uniref:ABC transporter permease n=1 Tax=Bosea caraganae TaxID=2763117 RepID=A0A370L983_9HYPH|nr:ABC transporter permease [Bosea caraganae]RDJ26954.1 ABC transporter permease [Bosea caraganae]RDJ30841.1 ABC transporter permease [Bosea caraganae]
MSAAERTGDVTSVLPEPAQDERSEFGDSAMLGFQFLLAVVVLFMWQGASGRLVDDFFVSNPIDVFRRLYTWTANGSIFQHIAATIYETIAGFMIGASMGVLLGIWLGMSRFYSRLLNPFLWALNALPKVALAPLFVLWFGLGLESKIALAAILTLFIVFINTYQGIKDVDEDLLDTVRLMKATRGQLLRKVILPSSVAWIFTGFKVALPNALIGAVIGEMIASSYGLGYLVQLSGAQFDTAGVFAVLFVIGILAVILNQLIEMAHSRLDHWRVLNR